MPKQIRFKGWLTAGEAQQLLGMTYSALRNQVIAGNIKSMTPPGSRQARYSKGDVYRLKRSIEAALAAQNNSPTEFVKATIEDMPAAVALAAAVFGDVNTISVEKRVEWLKKNPDIDYLLKQEGQLVGYISLVPLTPEAIEDLLTQRRFAKDLTGNDIVSYVPGQPVDIYGMAIGTQPGVSKEQKREWGAALLRGAQDVLEDLGHRGIVIRSIKAHSNTPDGIRLMRHLGFTETEATIPNMRDFVIDVATSGIPFIKRSKEAFTEWQKAHVNGHQPAQLSATNATSKLPQSKNQLVKPTSKRQKTN